MGSSNECCLRLTPFVPLPRHLCVAARLVRRRACRRPARSRHRGVLEVALRAPKPRLEAVEHAKGGIHCRRRTTTRSAKSTTTTTAGEGRGTAPPAPAAPHAEEGLCYNSGAAALVVARGEGVELRVHAPVRVRPNLPSSGRLVDALFSQDNRRQLAAADPADDRWAGKRSNVELLLLALLPPPCRRAARSSQQQQQQQYQ